MRYAKSLAFVVVLVAAVAALPSCRSAKNDTFTYDPAAHQRAVELKSKTLAVIASAIEAYARHKGEVEAVGADLEKAYELSAAAPDNEAVTAEWAAMKDPGGDLFGGVAARWQASGRLDEATRDAATGRISARYDYILCLEAAKRTKGGICTPPGGAAPDAAAEPGAPPPSG